MKKLFYSLLVLFIVLFTGMGLIPSLNATPIDSIQAVVVPVSCFGSGNGQITITPFGGTPPYNYYWSDGSSLKDRIGLNPGTYSVTVYDSDGDQKSDSYQITQPNPLSLESMVFDVQCYGGNDGGIDLTVTGGTPPFSFVWSNGATTEDLASISAGIYHIIVTDNNGCQVAGDIPVTEPASTFEVVVTEFNVSCFGGDNGTILVNMNGGTSPYTFLWNDGATTQNRTGLTAGNYYVTVYDAGGVCSAAPALITQPVALTVSSVVTPVSCFGTSTGSIDLTVSGGTLPYSYQWTNGASTEDLSALSAGTYSVTVTDNLGCTNMQGPFELQQPPQLVLSYSQGNVTCNGGQDGYIDVLITGGVEPYSYLWSTGANTPYLSSLPAGIYTLTVTDFNNCQVVQPVTITQPASIDPHAEIHHITCFGAANGLIQLSPTGGNPPYTYLWNTGSQYPVIFNLQPGSYSVTVTDNSLCTSSFNYTIQQPDYLWCGGLVSNESCLGGDDGAIAITVFGGTQPYSFLWNDGFTTQNRTGLLIGDYTVTVTDFNHCTYSATFTVGQPQPFVVTETITHVSCFDGNNGAINLDITGGTSPYSYSWSNGDTIEDISGLTAGSYTVTITDHNGCTDENTFVVTQPELLTVTGSTTPVSCPDGNDGAIDILADGGTPPYSYGWNDNGTEGSRTGLIAGLYHITVTDGQGCTATESFTITQPGVFQFGEIITNLSCNNAADGSVTINPSGGTSPYTFIWSTGSTENTITGLDAGTYTVTITDNNNCSTSHDFIVTQPDPLTTSHVVTNVSCDGASDGAIALTTTGGTEPYTWSWNNGETTEDISGLTAGDYTITVLDYHNCTVTSTITITQPNAIAIGVTINNITCYNGATGSISVNISGGTPEYTYLWDDNSTNPDLGNLTAGDYFFTVTDNNGCTATSTFTVTQPDETVALNLLTANVSCHGGADGIINLQVSGGTPDYTFVWSNGATTEDIDNLTAGSYEVTVTDNAGNCSVKSATITQPLAIQVTAAYTLPTCHGDSDGLIDISVSEGTGPYTFNWTGGITDEDLTGIAAGTYELTITDHNGCTLDTAFTLSEPEALQLASTVNNVSCNGLGNGSIEILTTGGNPDYSWEWSNGETTENITGLVPDTYYLTVTDNHGCILNAQFDITEPDVLELITDLITNVTCHGAPMGSVALTTQGGNTGFEYLWSNGATTEDLIDVTDGNYSVTVTDAKGCTVSGTYNITADFTIMISATIVDVSCLASSTGSISAAAAGGTAPYVYEWSNGLTGDYIDGLQPGNYTVTVTDDNGCIQIETFTVGQIDNITITSTVTNVSCYGIMDGSIQVSATGGLSPYSWTWSIEDTATLIRNLRAGTYYVTVTDQIGCNTADTFEITQPLPVTGTIGPQGQVLYCRGEALTPVVYTADNYPASAVTYSWTRNKVAEVSGIPANGTGVIEGSLTNNTTSDQHIVFTVNVLVDGCNAGTYYIDVYVAAGLFMNFNYQPLTCNGETTQVQIQALGGAAPYTGVQTVNLGAGTYIYTISDYYNCSVTDTLVITEPPAIYISGTVNAAICSNQPNAGINVTVTGGVPPYTYLWSDGNTNEDRSGLIPGYYTLTVTDDDGCTQTRTFNVGSFYNAPQGYLQVSPIGCYGQANPVYIYLSGTPPWNLTYTVNGTPTTVTNINTNTYTFYVTLLQTTTFQLTSLTDAHCSGTITSQPLVMNVVQPPTASLTPPQPICKGENSNITVHLNGTPPFTLTWFNGTPHTVNNITSNTYTIVSAPQVTTQYSIQSLSDVYCNSGSTVTPVYQIVYPLPTAMISGTPAICAGNSASVQVSFTGNPPFTFTYNDGNGNHTISNINATNYNLIVSPNVTTYYIPVSVSDYRCTGTVSGQAAVLVHPRPTASWSGPDSVCNNTDVTLYLNLTGTPPWNITWNDGQPHTVSNVMITPFVISSHMTANKTFSVTALSDGFCQSNSPVQYGQPKLVKVHQTPVGIMTGPAVNCQGVGSDLTVTLTGTPPWTIGWYDGSNTNIVENISASPYYIHVDPSVSTSYFLTSVYDVFCQGNIQGSPVAMSVVPAPVLSLEGLSSENSVCVGSQLNLTANFSAGVSPFSLTYLDANGFINVIPNLDNGSVINIIPPQSAGSYIYTLLSVSSSNGCEVLLNQYFTINVIPAPLISAGSDTSVVLGDPLVLQGVINGGIPPFNIQWTPADYLDDPTSLNPVSTPLTNIVYTLHVTDSIGCEVYDQVAIQVDVSRNIFGYITYDNITSTPLNNVLVKALNAQNVIIDSTYTNAEGYYAFSNLPDGNYHLKCSTNIPYGGVNATDALLTLKHFVGQGLLPGIRRFACDVNGSGFINSVDALSISLRFTQQITTFPIGDWYFQTVNFTIPTSTAQYDVKVLCVGDANGSYNPASKLEPGVSVTNQGEILAQNDKDLMIPVRISKPATIGAISLVMNYPEESILIKDVNLPDGKSLQFKALQGELRISWYDIHTLSVPENEVLLIIKAAIINKLQDNIAVISLGSATESELADQNGNMIPSSELIIPKITLNQEDFDLQVNYPNPFSQYTHITYSIPQEGFVNLTILDALGREISVPVKADQAAGKYTITFDGTGLPEGIYLYRIVYNDGKGERSVIRKMNLLR